MPLFLRPANVCDADGWIYVADPQQGKNLAGSTFQYTVLLQPMASDAVFTASNALSVQGNFSGGGSVSDWTIRHSYLLRDNTGSIFNPFHNYAFSPPSTQVDFRNPQLFGKITSDVATANIQGEPLMNLQLRLSW